LHRGVRPDNLAFLPGEPHNLSDSYRTPGMAPVLRFLEQRKKRPWKRVTSARLAAASALVGLLALAALRGKGFIPVIDHANLVFHEAGHVIFGLLGETLGLYGGTLGQLAFPCVVVVSFWSRREPISFVLGGVWLSENLLNIARYVGDARARVLPLVGSGEHDWAEILSRWGALASDIRIASVVNAMGWAGFMAAWGWVVWRWWRDRRWGDEQGTLEGGT
jgi:hypothetical protein